MSAAPAPRCRAIGLCLGVALSLLSVVAVAQSPAAPPEPTTPCDSLGLRAGDRVPANVTRSTLSQRVQIVRSPRGCSALATADGVLLTPMRYIGFRNSEDRSREFLNPQPKGKALNRLLVEGRLMPAPLTAGEIARMTAAPDMSLPELPMTLDGHLFAVDFAAPAAWPLPLSSQSDVAARSMPEADTRSPLANWRVWTVTVSSINSNLVVWRPEQREPQVLAGATFQFVGAVGARNPDANPGALRWFLATQRPDEASRRMVSDVFDEHMAAVATGLASVRIPGTHDRDAARQHGVLMVMHTADGRCQFVDRRGLRPWSASASASADSELEACAVVGLTNYAVFNPALHDRFRRPSAAVLVGDLAVRPPDITGFDAAQVQEGAFNDPKRTDWVVWRTEPDPANPGKRRRLWALADLSVADDQATLRAPASAWYLGFSGQDCHKRCAGLRIEDRKWQIIEQGREVPGAIVDKLPDGLRTRFPFSM